MAEPKICHQLNSRGMRVRDLLLDLLDMPLVGSTIKEKIFNRDSPPRDLDRAEGIDFIIASPTKPISSVLLRKFFTGIIEVMAEGYPYQSLQELKDNDINRAIERFSTLQEIGLSEYYSYHVNGDSSKKRKWSIPSDLYIQVQCPINQTKRRKEVERLLRSLNCKDQIDNFKKAFEDPKQYHVFSVEASGCISQKWLMNRLILLTKSNFEGSCQICYFAYDNKKPIEYQSFLHQLSIKIKSNCEDIFDELFNSERVVVIVLHGFSRRLEFQQELFQEIYKKQGSRLAECIKPGIVLFWLDESAPYFYHQPIQPWQLAVNENIIPLGQLKIEKEHVDDWVESLHESFEILNNINSSTLVKDKLEWDCSEQILERICSKLNVEGGMNVVSKLWKWS